MCPNGDLIELFVKLQSDADMPGHFAWWLGSKRSINYVWASTDAAKTDYTYNVSDARKMLAFGFRISAKEEAPTWEEIRLESRKPYLLTDTVSPGVGDQSSTKQFELRYSGQWPIDAAGLVMYLISSKEYAMEGAYHLNVVSRPGSADRLERAFGLRGK